MAPIICMQKDPNNTLNSSFYSSAIAALCLMDLMDIVALPTVGHTGLGPAHYSESESESESADNHSSYVSPVPCDW